VRKDFTTIKRASAEFLSSPEELFIDRERGRSTLLEGVAPRRFYATCARHTNGRGTSPDVRR